MQVTQSYQYIPVSDLQRSAAWYKEHLGFEVVHTDPIYLELRTRSGVRIMLIPNEKTITSHMVYPNGPQAAYGFLVTDIEGVHEEFVRKGIRVGDLVHYDGTSFSFRDPDGNVLELWGDYTSK